MNGRQRVAVVNSGLRAVCGGRTRLLVESRAEGRVMEVVMVRRVGGIKFYDLASPETSQDINACCQPVRYIQTPLPLLSLA